MRENIELFQNEHYEWVLKTKLVNAQNKEQNLCIKGGTRGIVLHNYDKFMRCYFFTTFYDRYLTIDTVVNEIIAREELHDLMDCETIINNYPLYKDEIGNYYINDLTKLILNQQQEYGADGDMCSEPLGCFLEILDEFYLEHFNDIVFILLSTTKQPSRKSRHSKK